jgi:Protein of unknown function (DUF1552)
MRYAFSRRSFLSAVGASAGLAALLRNVEAQEQGAVSPKRFLCVQRPVGTVYNNYWPTGTGSNFKLSRILTPFEALRERMIVFRDLELPWRGSEGGGHERGTAIMLTGVRTTELYPGNGGDDPVAFGPSVDQLFVTKSDDLKHTPVASLQVSCDGRADTTEISTRHMSYSGYKAPMAPYYQAVDAYERLFGSLMPGGTTSENLEALARARAQKKSVLDFALKDLARLRTLAPASSKELLDGQEASIRALEVELDADPRDPVFCGVAAKPDRVAVSEFVDPDPYQHGNAAEPDDVKHKRIGDLHFAVIKAAFRCDLTRVATFQWAPGTSHVSFPGMWMPDPKVIKVHHTESHDAETPARQEYLTLVDTWYSERLAGYLQELATTDDLGGGKLLDNTIVPYVTEVGTAGHNWDNMPWLLFGGSKTGLKGNQLWTNGGGGMRCTNDLWMAVARFYGLNDFTLGDKDLHTVPIAGLFA